MIRWFLLLLIVCNSVFAAGQAPLNEGPATPGYVQKPDWFKASFLDLREDVAEAAKGNKGVILYFYQNGCPYCERLINVNFAEQEISGKARSKFDVIAIDIWGDREVTDLKGKLVTEKEFASIMKVQFTPTLLFLDGQGDVTLRTNGYYPPHKFSAALDYASGAGNPGETFADYFERLNPTPATGKLHIEHGFLRPPYSFALKGERKPLLVLFEQKECPACDELHNVIFRRAVTRALLNRFDIAVVDIWSNETLQTNTGELKSAREWAREMNIQYAPTLVFFNPMGKEVFRTEAYLRAFHIQSALDYVSSGAYRDEKEFQRYVQSRADELRAKGVKVDLWK